MFPLTKAKAVQGDCPMVNARFRRLVVPALLVFLAAPATAAEPPLTQSFDMRVPVAPTPVPVDGASRLLYELHLTNFSGAALQLVGLDVREQDSGETLASFDAGELDARLYRPGTPDGSAHLRTVPSGLIAVVYLEIATEGAALPVALDHRLNFRTTDDDARLSSIAAAPTPVRTEPPVVLGPPLRGGPWAAVHDPGWERSHRRVFYAVAGRAVIPGRYAIDWVKLDDDGRRARGDKDRIANWHGYGAEVLAVADGVVAAARDDVAESPTLSEHPRHPLTDATGNYVALEIGDGRYVFYEHLKPGSVRVEAGDPVTRGEPIGAVGFTGHSMGPHLHFHVADANSPLAAEGLPFVLDQFAVIGRYDGFDVLADVPWSAPGSGSGSSRRTGERPAPNVVVQFP